MVRAQSLKPRGTFSERPADTIVLDFEARHRRRLAFETTHGIAFLLDLPETVRLRDGDALVLDDGRLIEVVAAPEPLIEIRCSEPRELARIAWHLGNRHLPVEILAKALRLRRDHVIEDMVAKLGGKVREIEAPFMPESGAYAQAQAEVHGHVHGHGHDGHAHHDHHGHADHAHSHDHHHGHGHRAHDNHDHEHHDHKHHGHDHHDHDHHDHHKHG
jgi:urease accessory protein